MSKKTGSKQKCYVSVVDRILAKERLSLDDVTLKVSQLKPAPPPTVPKGPVDPHLVLVRHIPTKCSPNELRAFLCKHGSCEVKDVQYGLEPGTALVRFQSKPGET